VCSFVWSVRFIVGIWRWVYHIITDRGHCIIDANVGWVTVSWNWLFWVVSFANECVWVVPSLLYFFYFS
jgi:hypothetical protein